MLLLHVRLVVLGDHRPLVVVGGHQAPPRMSLPLPRTTKHVVTSQSHQPLVVVGDSKRSHSEQLRVGSSKGLELVVVVVVPTNSDGIFRPAIGGTHYWRSVS